MDADVKEQIDRINKKLESTLTIILEHFKETDERIESIKRYCPNKRRQVVAIEFMAENEVLNDPAAHFFKSGNVGEMMLTLA